MSKLFVALDFDNENKALEVCSQCRDDVHGFKIGLELFCSCGRSIVEKVSEFGEIFLDLKFHDIPNTVLKVAESVARLPVSIINLHAVCGPDTMKMVREKVKDINPQCKVIGVTMLTSVDNMLLKTLNCKSEKVSEQVEILASLVYSSGLDGIVCSPEEVAGVKKRFGKDFLTVVPGIRPLQTSVNDQKRIATPKQAVKNGADILICGRPVYNAENIRKAVQDIRRDMEE